MTFDIDSQIIKRLSDGDQGAFRVVFEHYYPRVSEFVRRIVKDDNLAEDITQISLSKFGSVARFSGWRFRHSASISMLCLETPQSTPYAVLAAFLHSHPSS